MDKKFLILILINGFVIILLFYMQFELYYPLNYFQNIKTTQYNLTVSERTRLRATNTTLTYMNTSTTLTTQRTTSSTTTVLSKNNSSTSTKGTIVSISTTKSLQHTSTEIDFMKEFNLEYRMNFSLECDYKIPQRESSCEFFENF